MKAKKKTINEATTKNELKNEKKESNIMKKSPVKLKNNQHQNPFLSSSDSNSFHPFKNINTYYGKKTHLNDLSQKKESNQSSTHCSINNRSHKEKSFENKKKVKKTRKNFEEMTNEDDWSRGEISLNENQVMNLINSYATKIQRQWRRYWFRKCLSFIILKEKERRKYEELNECYALKNSIRQLKTPMSRVSYDFGQRCSQEKSVKNEEKRRSLPKLNSKRNVSEIEQKEQSSEELVVKENTSSIENQATEEYFNSKKYSSLLSFQSLSKPDVIKQSHERTSSLEEKFAQEQKQRVETAEIGLNCSLEQNKEIIPQFNTPISDLREEFESSQKPSDKKTHIKLEPKVYEFQIVEANTKPPFRTLIEKATQNTESNKSIEVNKVAKKSPRNELTSLENLKSNYDIKFPSSENLEKDPFGMTKIFKKCKKVIEKQVTKKIQTISKHYQDKQITERTYKNLINQTQEKLKTEIKSLEIKEGNIKNSWREVYNMFKEYVKETSFQHPDNKNNSFQAVNFDDEHVEHEVSFDKWDFESSAKKSISQLESFEDFARELNERNPEKLKGFYFETKRPQNDQKSIEKVLDELDKLESPSQLERKTEEELNEEESVLSILEEFKQRERSSSFQKKSQHMMVENIPSEKEIMSSNSLKNMEKTINKNNLQNKGKDEKEIEDLESIRIVEAKRELFEFPEIKTPTKSNKGSVEKLEVDKAYKVLYSPKTKERLNTDESEEDSEVEMRITSIKVIKENKDIPEKTTKTEKKSLQSLENEKKQKFELEEKLKQQKIQEQKILSEKFIQNLTNLYYEKIIAPKRTSNIIEISKVLTQVYIETKRKKELQAIELKKYPPTIDPQIDAINNWLLEISHHLLDNHNSEIKKNLLTVRQLPKEEMLQISQSENLSCTFFHSHPYITISEKIFKEFEFFYIKNVASSLEIEEMHEQNFEHLIYAFHRCLIDCMNLTLLDELSIGRNWVVIPWMRKFKYKKNEVYEHTKQCLERAINRVSGWAEYNLAQLAENTEISPQEWKQYQEEKINLVIREEILEYCFDNEFMESNLILKLCEQIYQEELNLAVSELMQTFNK